MHTRSELNEQHLDLLKSRFEEMKNYVLTAASQGLPAHEVELALWRRVLRYIRMLWTGMENERILPEPRISQTLK